MNKVESMDFSCSPEEWQVRVDLAACYRLCALNGWTDLISTHMSARVPGPDHHFLINPLGMMFDEVTASSLLKIDYEGNLINPSKYKVNAAGFVIHSAVHMARLDVACVMHTHTMAGTAVSMQKHGILPLNQHSLYILHDVAYHDYDLPVLTGDERNKIARDLGDKKILVMRNHGLLTVGRTVAEAFVMMHRAERACRMQVTFQSTGAEFAEIEPTIVDASIERGRNIFNRDGAKTAGILEWPALLRHLDRVQPEYKN